MKRKIVSLVLALTMTTGFVTECYASPGTFVKKVSGSVIQTVGDAFDFVKEKASNLLKKTYTYDDLMEMSVSEILELTKKIAWNDIEGLFSYSESAKRFYSDKARIDGLIEGLKIKATQYTRYDDAGIDTLVEILRSAFFTAKLSKCEELKYLTERSYHDKCIPGLIAIANSPYFELGSEEQDKVVNAYGKLIGNASTNAEVVNKAQKIIDQYYDNVKEYRTNKSKSDALHKIINKLCYDMERYCYYGNIHDSSKTPWYRKIDGFINSLVKLAQLDINSENEWIINNAISNLGIAYSYHSNPDSIHQIVDNIMNTAPKDCSTYLVTLSTLKIRFNSKDTQGNVIEIEDKISNRKNELLPKTYIFDNGQMIVKTGDKVSEDKVQRLYWASKEVKSQFFRFIGSDKALEPGNADDVLTVIIYNSPDEYKNNKHLYGYSTDNGGMYIEGTGTFFTYERTTAQSIYSLEELFRHEYTHYLQGRYLVPGLFGEGKFYKDNNSRLTWFEEGTAEFFAGSTRFNVEPRSTMVGNIDRNKEKRLDLNRLYHSSYNDGWEFYTYGYTFADYMYNNDMDLFNKFINSMKTNNVDQYEQIIQSESSNSRRNSSYQRHMNIMYNNLSSYSVPLVANDYMKNIAPYNSAQIQKDIENELGVDKSEIKVLKSPYFNTFELSVKYNLGDDKGNNNNFDEMNKVINKTLENLGNKDWDGYKTVTAYFANPTVQGNNVVYDIVFHGLLNQSEEFSSTPQPVVECDGEPMINQPVQFYGDKSKDDGQITSYFWDFGDGETSNEKNPIHTFKKLGKHTVNLTVTDDSNLNDNINFEVNVAFSFDGYEKVNESEKNNYYDEPNQIPLNTMVVGDLNNDDVHDIFKVSIQNDGEYLILVENSKKNKESDECHWYLVDKNDRSKTLDSGNYKIPQDYKVVKLNGPEDYVFAVTGSVKNKSDYKFIVLDLNNSSSNSEKPELPTQPEKPEVPVTPEKPQTPTEPPKPEIPVTPETEQKTINDVEKENNDTYKKANIISEGKVNGSLDSSDRCDTYKITFNEPCKIKIGMNVEEVTGSSTWLLYNSNDTRNYIATATNRNNSCIDGEVEISTPGEYYIVVYDAKRLSTEYELNVGTVKEQSNEKPDVIEPEKIEDEQQSEKENNDEYDKANRVEFNKPVKGALDSSDKCDIFSFDVEKQGNVDINLEMSKKTGSTIWLLYNANDTSNYINFATSSKQDFAKKEVESLSSGKYYVVVYDVNNDKLDYELNIDFSPSKSLKELKKEEVAKDVRPKEEKVVSFQNKETTRQKQQKEIRKYSGEFNGTLSEENTSDVHSFTLENSQNISISFNNKNNIGMAYSIYDSPSRTNLVAYGDKDNDVNLKAGTYYLYVYIYQYETGDYTATIR